MPPAFILSQNQTLKFNCLKSLFLSKIITALTLLSLADLLSRSYFSYFFEKLTEITFHLLVCQIKSHFFLILFLICVSTGFCLPCLSPRGDSLYIIPQTIYPCQVFFQTFFNFFKNFFRLFSRTFFPAFLPIHRRIPLTLRARACTIYIKKIHIRKYC